MSTSPTKAALNERLTELDRNIAELENRLSTLRGEREGIRFALGVSDPGVFLPAATRARRSDVKGIILNLLQKAGASGLNAAIAVEMAEREGQELKQPSASSILSRFKADGVVTYDGERYRLADSNSGWASNVHPHPASKGVLG